ncbi:hypothetical protein [Streptomyces sp. SID12501]|uniref:Uncharacterized protein n=1 Tax=Streptomyces sp. SID12501 TaxID=2706042 RepID=A0A6B3BVM6_9ACTN|nr:hypothetical protein [Streptomyces sp. SID12501]NEC88378.1 hypothetical protein [Streptomyces sp. SID12501]
MDGVPPSRRASSVADRDNSGLQRISWRAPQKLCTAGRDRSVGSASTGTSVGVHFR